MVTITSVKIRGSDVEDWAISRPDRRQLYVGPVPATVAIKGTNFVLTDKKQR